GASNGAPWTSWTKWTRDNEPHKPNSPNIKLAPGDPEVSFGAFGGEADYAAGFAGRAVAFVLQEFADHRGRVFISLDDHGGDDLAVEIQGHGRQGLFGGDFEGLDVAVILAADFQFQLLRPYAQFGGVDGTEAVDVVEQGDIGL